MKYKLRFITVLGLILAFTALLIAATAFGVESAMPGVIILAWVIGSLLLHYGITAITKLSEVLVERYLAEATVEKRKRNHIDTRLQDLSDSELMRLKQRLNDGTVNDEMLYKAIIGDDSELLYDD